MIFFFAKGTLPAHDYNTVMLLVAISGFGVLAVSITFLFYDSSQLESSIRAIGDIQDVTGGYSVRESASIRARLLEKSND